MAREAIFVGYRRDDTADVAGRIYDAMAQRFGRQRIFKDVDDIGPGVDFGDYIKTVLPRCRVALVLIGPNWIDARDDSGRRRIDDEHDWVRIEIETAFSTPEILVVPVLVNGARMPRLEELPDSLKPLLRRNAAVIRRDPDFHDDVERLATALRASVRSGIFDSTKIGGRPPSIAPVQQNRLTNKRLVLVAGAIFVVALIAVGFGVLPSRPGPQASADSSGQLPAVQTGPSLSSGQPLPTPDSAAWSRVNSRSPTELREFLRDNSTNNFADEARRQLQLLDREAWRKASHDTEAPGAVEALRTYIKDFPAGDRASEATRLLMVPDKRKHVAGSDQLCLAPPDTASVYFEFDKATLTSANRDTIDAVAARWSNIFHIDVIGHDDAAGLASSSMDISERRALVVRDALIAQGVKSSVIGVWADGELNLPKPTPDGFREPLNRAVTLMGC